MVKRQPTYESALARAASPCSRGEHAEAEMRRKLRQWGAETGDADRVVEWLVDNGFIDNSRYAHAFVYDKSRFDLWGRVKIRHQLRLNGVTGDVVDEAMAEIDEDEYVAKSRTLTVADPYKRKASLMRYGASRGYEPSLVLKVMAGIVDGAEDFCDDGIEEAD